MMKTDCKLTLPELEALCEAFLDCRLSRLQEKELELVLLHCSLSSPRLDEVRQIMALSSLMEESAASHTAKRKEHHMRHRKWYAAASCAAVIVAAASVILTVLMRPDTSAVAQQQDYIAVYVDGHMLSGKTARAKANDIQTASMNMLQELLQETEETTAESLDFMNSILAEQ